MKAGTWPRVKYDFPGAWEQFRPDALPTATSDQWFMWIPAGFEVVFGGCKSNTLTAEPRWLLRSHSLHVDTFEPSHGACMTAVGIE